MKVGYRTGARVFIWFFIVLSILIGLFVLVEEGSLAGFGGFGVTLFLFWSYIINRQFTVDSHTLHNEITHRSYDLEREMRGRRPRVRP